ncbi:MAG: toll/interleukin-1 receptor domain-containing protein [Deltaproteobacteria bacterium]|nr:toll/interleukin-1 receptor domain-containing protein [Deltaproteobacteria bacterium]
MEVNFPTDTDGFLSQECPSCEQRFKVHFGEGSEEPISFCPYCGHNGRDCWYTKEQVAYIEAVAANRVLGPELKKLEREMKRASGGLLKIDMKTELPKPGSPPMETDEQLEILRFTCCNETVKLTRHDRHYCIICGKETNMTVSNAKKVFLSHKGIDKAEVTEYKTTLALLGYDPWFDEDAMPAGTPLERGLLQGMRDSCGVVFFITPSFKDEGYLETEINYAIQEKRQKSNKFAVITLQFIGVDGKLGKIPDLLKTYVWKKPKTSLEALREIIRALPIAPSVVDWREGIESVITVPKTKSTSTELSHEAKMILKAATSADGHVMCLRYLGGQTIQAGGKQLIPDESPRTIARWVGGIEDLQRRRYIVDIGHKGEVFQVTREGYEAADLVSDN